MLKKIGIVGGMGPLATVKLFQLIVQNTKSEDDSHHIRIFIDNNPQIPDRTESILYKGQSPVKDIVCSAKSLISLGADFILLPCNTSHFYYREIQDQLDVPVLNMIELTSLELKNCNIKKVGLLATAGTIKSGVYEKYNLKNGIQTIVPTDKEEQIIMDYIYNVVKAGKTNYDCTNVYTVIKNLRDKGSEKIILGCTELSVGMDSIFPKEYCVDALEILAKNAILSAGYQM